MEEEYACFGEFEEDNSGCTNKCEMKKECEAETLAKIEQSKTEHRKIDFAENKDKKDDIAGVILAGSLFYVFISRVLGLTEFSIIGLVAFIFGGVVIGRFLWKRKKRNKLPIKEKKDKLPTKLGRKIGILLVLFMLLSIFYKITFVENAAGHVNRGDDYAIEGDYFKAISEYERAIELNPKLTDAYNNRGYVYFILREYTKAITNYNKAIELDSKYALGYVNRGTVYLELRDYSKAISDFTKAIELDPEFAMAYNNRGTSYEYLEDYSRAMNDFNKAIEFDPKLALAYYNRGSTYYYLGDYSKAISDFTKAIELDPEYAEAYYFRGYVYDELGDSQMAQGDFDMATRLNPSITTEADNFSYETYRR